MMFQLVNCVENRLFFLVLNLGFFILPFIYWPWSEVPYEIPRVWFVNRWIEILAFTFILTRYNFSKKQKSDSVLIFSAIFLIVIALISSVFGSDLTKSIWGNYYRKDGIYTLAHLIVFFLLISVFIKRIHFRKLITPIALGSVLVSFYSIFLNFQYYMLRDLSVPNFDGVMGATFGQPLFLAGYLLVTLPFVLAELFMANRRKVIIFWFIGIVVQVLAILLTHSWGGIIGLILLPILLSLFFVKRNKLLLILGFFLIFLLSCFSYFYVQKKLMDKVGLIAESRPRIIYKGLLGFKQKPFLGWGWANFDYAFESRDWPIRLANDAYVDKAHSTILEIMVTTGIFGLLIYLLLIFRTIRNFTKDKSFIVRIYFLVFLLYLFHSQTNVISIAEELVFWLVLGMSSKIRF